MRLKMHPFTPLLFLVLLACRNLGATESPKIPPDLTQDRNVDRKLTYNLGSTGLRGWIYTRPANYLDGVQGRTTTASRQILVTHVGAKSPADGVMKVDDVILGVGGKLFNDDARRTIAAAIQEAEKEASGGILSLTIWRAGKIQQVQLKLQVVGTYSDTAPYNCPKSKRIYEQACAVLAKEPLAENWSGAISGLALMATGKPQHMPRVRDFARKLAPQTLKLDRKVGVVTWEWGYRDLFLCEYYLLTRDEQVLHAISEYTVALARGQSMYGTFGHGGAPPTADGQLHGSITPYGPVNAAGLVANLAIVMGKKCGVKHPEIDPAVERASGFFGYYTDKGAIRYGEHGPWPYHDNNGKNAMTAVMFAAQGDHPIETRFFAQMVTASYENREFGHTGQGFSYLWGALGANVAGPDAAAAFFKQASAHLDLARRCDGSFTYDGGEQYGAGRTDDDSYYGKSGYYGMSPTACYVLTYSLPFRTLCITGKDANSANWLDRKCVAQAIASGRFDLDRKKKTVAELVAAFSDWSPVVRGWAAEELALRPEAPAMVPQLIAMAQGPDAHARQGACEALGYIKSTAALPVLARQLTHEDRWLRVKAADALKNIGANAKPAVPDMLKAVVKNAEPLKPIDWADPVQISQTELADALFAGRVGTLQEVDRELLYPAVRAISRTPDGAARATLRHYFESRLTPEDVQALAPDLLAAIHTRAPADTMFANEIQMGALKALAKYHYREGIDAGVLFAKNQGGHGSENRTGEIMKVIASYGSAARGAIPGLRELIVELNEQVKQRKFPDGLNKSRVTAVEEAIKEIEAAHDAPQLRSMPARPAP